MKKTSKKTKIAITALLVFAVTFFLAYYYVERDPAAVMAYCAWVISSGHLALWVVSDD